MNERPFDSASGEEIEVRLTALVMGEASDFERSQLEALMNERPELKAEYEQLQRLHASLAAMDLSDSGESEQEADREPKLSGPRRSTLLAVLDGQQLNPVKRQLDHHSPAISTAYWNRRRLIWWCVGLATAASLFPLLLLSQPQAAREVSMRLQANVDEFSGGSDTEYRFTVPQARSGLEVDDESKKAMLDSIESYDIPAPVPAPVAEMSVTEALDDDVQELSVDPPGSSEDIVAGKSVEMRSQFSDWEPERGQAANAPSFAGRVENGRFGETDEKAGEKADTASVAPPADLYWHRGEDQGAASMGNYFSSPTAEFTDSNFGSGSGGLALPEEPKPNTSGYAIQEGRWMAGGAVNADAGRASGASPAKPQSVQADDAIAMPLAQSLPVSGPEPAAPAITAPLGSTAPSTVGRRPLSSQYGMSPQSSVAPAQTPRILIEDGEQKQSEFDSDLDGMPSATFVPAPSMPQAVAIEDHFSASLGEAAPADGPVTAKPDLANSRQLNLSSSTDQPALDKRYVQPQPSSTTPQTPPLQVDKAEQSQSGFAGNGIANPQVELYGRDTPDDSVWIDRESDSSDRPAIDLGIEFNAANPAQLAENLALYDKMLREREEIAARRAISDFDGAQRAEAALEKSKSMLTGNERLKGVDNQIVGLKDAKKEIAGDRLGDIAKFNKLSDLPVDRELERKRKQLQPLDELTAAREPFSTFSLHVSDVSFKLAASALASGQWPEAAKIRIEEFVNALDYFDPLPSRDERVACQIEQAVHPFMMQRNVLRISLRTAATGRPQSVPLRLTLLLDNSGSMERADRRQTIRKAFEALAAQVQPHDQVTLISFANQPRLLAERFSGSQVAELVALVDSLPSEGGTNLEAALKLAMEKASEGVSAENAAGLQNRIVLMTDGAVNLGDADPANLSQLVLQMRDAGIAFDAAGISAQELNDEVLEALTRQGDGRYYLLDSAEDARTGFADQIAGALRPAAKNVKVQVEFNPDRVGRYKLLGFEKHLLKQEDFRNDKVDAAEMAAAEAGVAMYQFEPNPDGRGDIGSVSVRFQDLATGAMVERRWPIPYEPSAARIDQASPRIRLATTAAMFAAKLRGDALGDAVELKSLADTLATLPPNFETAPRVQQLQSMINTARQIGEP